MPFSAVPSGETESSTTTDLVAKTMSRLPVLDRPVVLSVEGNIGAGKSTFLKLLNKHFGEESIEVMQEPVHRWTDCRGQNMLDTFYKDPGRYAFTFQSYAFITRLMEQQKPQQKAIRILERSALSDHCFARNCHETGLMNDVEWAAYQEWWSFFSRSMPGGPDGILYLRTTPTTCFRRMNIRNRSEEVGVPLEYLNQLHDQHEQWLQPGENSDNKMNLPYARLNADEEFENDLEAQKRMVDAVVDLIHRIFKTK